MTHCDDIRPIIREYLEEALDEASSSLVAGHLDSCRQCTRLLTAIVDDARSDAFDDVAGMLRGGGASALPSRIRRRPTHRRSRVQAATIAAFGLAVVAVVMIIVLRRGNVHPPSIEEPRVEMPTSGAPDVEEALRALRSLRPMSDEDIEAEEYDFEDGSEGNAVMVALRSADRRLVRRRTGDEAAVPVGGRNGGVTWYRDAGSDRIVVSPENLPSAITEPAPPIGRELSEWLNDADVRARGFETVEGVRGLVFERLPRTDMEISSRLTVEPSSGRVLMRVDRRSDGRHRSWRSRGRRQNVKDFDFLPGSWITSGVRIDVDWAGFESDGVSIGAVVDALRARGGVVGTRPIMVVPGSDPRDSIVEALLSDTHLSSALGPKGRDQLAQAVARVLEKGGTAFGSVILSEQVIFDPPLGLLKAVPATLLETSKSLSEFARSLGEETGVKIEMTCADRRLSHIAYPSTRPMGIELLSAVAAFSGLELRFERDRVVISISTKK